MGHIFSKDIFGHATPEVQESAYAPDQFEQTVREVLELEYTPSGLGFSFEINERWSVKRGRKRVTICPDIVITGLAGPDEKDRVYVVADAKLRGVLDKRAAERVAAYGRHLRPLDPPARIYIPTWCKVTSGAQELHDKRKVVIERLDVDDSGRQIEPPGPLNVCEAVFREDPPAPKSAKKKTGSRLPHLAPGKKQREPLPPKRAANKGYRRELTKSKGRRASKP